MTDDQEYDVVVAHILKFGLRGLSCIIHVADFVDSLGLGNFVGQSRCTG